MVDKNKTKQKLISYDNTKRADFLDKPLSESKKTS